MVKEALGMNAAGNLVQTIVADVTDLHACVTVVGMADAADLHIAPVAEVADFLLQACCSSRGGGRRWWVV